MRVLDFDGEIAVETVAELARRLRDVRRGTDGAFVLWHDEVGPNLWVHINQTLAYLHYFPGRDGKHPGFTKWGTPPVGCQQEVRFLLVGGDEGSAIVMTCKSLVPVETAYKVAVEFFHAGSLPASVEWSEL